MHDFADPVLIRPFKKSEDPVKKIEFISAVGSVADPWHFGKDPDPRIRTGTSD